MHTHWVFMTDTGTQLDLLASSLQEAIKRAKLISPKTVKEFTLTAVIDHLDGFCK